MKKIFIINDKLFYKVDSYVQMYLISDIQQCDKEFFYQICGNKLFISIQFKISDEPKKLSLQILIPKKYENKKILGLINYHRPVIYNNEDIERWKSEAIENNLAIENIILKNLSVNKSHFYDCLTELKRVVSKVNGAINDGRCNYYQF